MIVPMLMTAVLVGAAVYYGFRSAEEEHSQSARLRDRASNLIDILREENRQLRERCEELEKLRGGPYR